LQGVFDAMQGQHINQKYRQLLLFVAGISKAFFQLATEPSSVVGQPSLQGISPAVYAIPHAFFQLFIAVCSIVVVVVVIITGVDHALPAGGHPFPHKAELGQEGKEGLGDTVPELVAAVAGSRRAASIQGEREILGIAGALSAV
jgi:hypothetical protein